MQNSHDLMYYYRFHCHSLRSTLPCEVKFYDVEFCIHISHFHGKHLIKYKIMLFQNCFRSKYAWIEQSSRVCIQVLVCPLKTD